MSWPSLHWLQECYICFSLQSVLFNKTFTSSFWVLLKDQIGKFQKKLHLFLRAFITIWMRKVLPILYCRLLSKLILNKMEFKSMRKEQYFQCLKFFFTCNVALFGSSSLCWNFSKKSKVRECFVSGQLATSIAWKNCSHIFQWNELPGE